MSIEEVIELVRGAFSVAESASGHSEEADEACNIAIAALHNAADRQISYSRMEELATLFKDGLMCDEVGAMEYFDDVCEMTYEEKEFFGLFDSRML